MNQIIKQLKTYCHSDDELSIEYESSPEEAVLIGTKQAYLNVAIKLLEIAAQAPEAKMDSDNVNDMNIKYSNEVKYAFNEFGKLFPVVAYLSDSSEEVEKIINYINE